MSSSSAEADGGMPTAKVPRTAEPAPDFASLHATLVAVTTQLSQLAVDVAGLKRAQPGAPPPQPPPYPTVVNADALARLAADPLTPPHILPFLTTFAAIFPHVLDEGHQGMIQQCYNHALLLRAPPHPNPTYPSVAPRPITPHTLNHHSQLTQSVTPSTHAPALTFLPRGSTLPPGALLIVRGSSHFVDYAGVVYYWALSGWLRDSRLPPGQPCHHCQVPHWAWQCPYNNGTRPAPPAPTTLPFPVGGGQAVLPPSM